jgi:hypothetical protein
MATTRRSLASLVQAAFPSPEWAVFYEVQDPGSGRRADAVALGIWPSRGYSLVGFEFKEYRNDWLREKKNPAKADRIASKVDAWWVVAGAADVVDIEELPEPWGLMVAAPDRARLVVKKKPAPYQDRDRSVIAREFVAAMLRKVTENTIPKSTLDELIQSRVDQELARTREGHALQTLKDRVQRLEAERDTFRKITGVELSHWSGTENVAKAVAALLEGEKYRRRLEEGSRALRDAAKAIDGAVKTWPSLPTTAAVETSYPVTDPPPASPVPEEIRTS